MDFFQRWEAFSKAFRFLLLLFSKMYLTITFLNIVFFLIFAAYIVSCLRNTCNDKIKETFVY